MTINYSYSEFQLNRVGDKVDDFQTKLSTYFNDLAEFDKNLAEKDLAYVRHLYNGHVRDIVTISNVIAENFRKLFILGFTMAAGEIGQRIHRLSLEIANSINPIKGLAEGFKVMTDVMDAMTEVAKASAVMARIISAFEREKPIIDKIANQIEESRKKNDVVLEKMRNILTAKEPMTMENATNFLDEYFEWDKYGESEQIVKIGAIQESLLETTCDSIKGSSTVPGSAIELVEAGICPFLLVHAFFAHTFCTRIFCTRISFYKKLRIAVF